MRTKSGWMLVAVLVTSAIALLDAWAGGRAILLGLLIAGPLLAATSLDVPRTAIVGLYALGLAVLLGIPDGILAPPTICCAALGWPPAGRWASSSPTVAPSRSGPWRASPGSPRSPSARSCGRSRPGWAGSRWPCATCRPARTPWSAGTSTTCCCTPTAWWRRGRPTGRQFELDDQVEAVIAASSLAVALEGLVARLLEHAGGRSDDDLALVLAQPRMLLGRTA